MREDRGFFIITNPLLLSALFLTLCFDYIPGFKKNRKSMNSLSYSLLNRSTIRKYKSDPVGEELLNELLRAAIRTPTTGNIQVYSIVVTTEEQIKKELLPSHFNQKMITEAPVVLTFCADFNRFNKWCRLRNAEPGYDNFLSFFTAAIDALLAAQTFCIAAESKGLGICYLGTTTYMAHKIIETLKLPSGVVPVTTVTLGWPAEKPEQVDRLPLEAVVHKQHYHDYNSPMIDELYQEKEERSDSKQFVSENNKNTLAQVFTDIRYKKADNTYFSRMLLQVLKDQGFMNNY